MVIEQQSLAVEYWYYMVVIDRLVNNANVRKMVATLQSEFPYLCSVTFERSCNLQCKHCIYQFEKTSGDISKEVSLESLIINIIHQMMNNKYLPLSPSLIHEGRIFTFDHLSSLRRIKEKIPTIQLGLIDNGTFINLLNDFHDFRFDWLDISLDGGKDIHNLQRNNKHAWDVAIEGLINSRLITIPFEDGGRVNALFTLTSINYHQVDIVSDFLFANYLKCDALYISTMSPARPELVGIEISIHQFSIFWQGLKRACAKYNKPQTRIYFRIYHLPDLYRLANVVGASRFFKIMTNASDKDSDGFLGVDWGRVTFMIDGVIITYYPASISIQETFLIDADGSYRLPYAISKTLEQLNSTDESKDFSSFTVSKLSLKSNYQELYIKAVNQWWKHFGRKHLNQELDFFLRIKQSI